ncbi:pilus assembly protein TadG-related protein [Kineosporia rhizophila]|nr:pilus assembly protein TadG-related protein [Kineosporia rhizophila]
MAALLFLGLLFAQVGSASEQKTQTQTAADSAAVAATHQLRDATILQAADEIPWGLGVLFAPLGGWEPDLTAAACAAAQRNWQENPHSGGLGCGDVYLAGTGDGVQVGVLAPPGQVIDGPADVQDQRAQAAALSRITFEECPAPGPAKQDALAHWLVDTTMAKLGHDSDCFTMADAMQLEILEAWPFPVMVAAVGPPEEILDAVRESLRIEIIG